MLAPKLIEKTVKLHPLAIIFGVFAGSEIGHVAGILLGVPLIATARLVFCEYQKMRLGELASMEPTMPDAKSNDGLCASVGVA